MSILIHVLHFQNALKSAFADLKAQCEKLGSAGSVEYNRILLEITRYCEIRCQMIDLYPFHQVSCLYLASFSGEETISAITTGLNFETDEFLAHRQSV